MILPSLEKRELNVKKAGEQHRLFYAALRLFIFVIIVAGFAALADWADCSF
jgi:hypothetical protein